MQNTETLCEQANKVHSLSLRARMVPAMLKGLPSASFANEDAPIVSRSRSRVGRLLLLYCFSESIKLQKSFGCTRPVIRTPMSSAPQ